MWALPFGHRAFQADARGLAQPSRCGFLFISTEGEGPEENYRKYVDEHLSGEDVVQVAQRVQLDSVYTLQGKEG